MHGELRLQEFSVLANQTYNQLSIQAWNNINNASSTPITVILSM